VATLYVPGKNSVKYELRALVDALALSLADPSLTLFQIQFSKNKEDDKSPPPTNLTSRVSQAHTTFSLLLTLHRLAGCLPLPFFLAASAKLEGSNPENQENCLAAALEKWRSKDSFGDEPAPSESEALSVQIAFAGITEPFIERFELPEGISLEALRAEPLEFLSVTLAKIIFGLLQKEGKVPLESAKTNS